MILYPHTIVPTINEFYHKNIDKLMLMCCEYNDMRNKLDVEIEAFVRFKVQYFVDNSDFFEAEKLVYKYYKIARLNNNGDNDPDFDVVLMGYENIMRDISRLKRNEDISPLMFSNHIDISDVDGSEKILNAVMYDSFIIKSGKKLAKRISDEVDELLREDTPKEALRVLSNFYHTSFKNGYSCFIEHDTLKAKILRYINKFNS